MNKMPKNGFLNVIIAVIVVVVLAGAGYFVLQRQPAEVETESVTEQNKISVPEEYVKKTQDSANQATFVFAVPVKKQDIVGTNIRHCIISVSAMAEVEGRQPTCTETTTANNFSLEYNETTRTLVITAKPEQGVAEDVGLFRIGCAACVSAVEFNGIHTSDGQLLPKRMVNVY